MHTMSVARSCCSMAAVFFYAQRLKKAVQELKQAGFTSGRILILGREHENEEHVRGVYILNERVEACGTMHAFWRSVWKMLPNAAFLMIPQFGLLIGAGSLQRTNIRAMEEATHARGITPLGAGLMSFDIPAACVPSYETALKSGKLLLVVQGSDDEIESARRILQTWGAEDIHLSELQEEVLLT
jgi:hypothetical protein